MYFGWEVRVSRFWRFWRFGLGFSVFGRELGYEVFYIVSGKNDGFERIWVVREVRF